MKSPLCNVIIAGLLAAFARAFPISKSRTRSTSMGVMYDPRSTEGEFVDFPTPSQIITLRKEASKRQARKTLFTFSLPEDETSGPFSEETLQGIWSGLSRNELLLVRGVSKDEKKFVYSTAERLCAELEMVQEEFPVTLLSTKGHTATIYCPALPLDHALHVPLRTSVGQKNTWCARPKAPRDERGQVIKDPPVSD